jgi:hypothetical protein
MTTPLHSAAAAAKRAAGAVVRRGRELLSSSDDEAADTAPGSGWLVVTVLLPPEQVEAAGPPQPLAELGDRVEVRVTPAPGDKGTELAARLRAATGGSGNGGNSSRDEAGAPSVADLRSALRRAKQLLEVGEVMAVDPAPHGHRSRTPGGALLEAATRRAGKEGVL